MSEDERNQQDNLVQTLYKIGLCATRKLGYSQDDANEIVQTVVVAIWKKNIISSVKNLPAYVKKSITNLHRSRCRYNYARRGMTRLENEVIQSKDNSPQENASDEELRVRVYDILKDVLGEKGATFLKDREINELSYEQLAQKYQLPLGTVKSKLYHLREKAMSSGELRELYCGRMKY